MIRKRELKPQDSRATTCLVSLWRSQGAVSIGGPDRWSRPVVPNGRRYGACFGFEKS